ncbi:I78 family peptidase inhibitor [Rhizobiaceae sp. 2RAB30]
MMDLRRLAGLSAATLLAAACQNEPAANAAQPGMCVPGSAEALVGKDRVTDSQAKQLTGASIVRQLKPGDMATMDFRQERVTIETDPKTGKIVRASCG